MTVMIIVTLNTIKPLTAHTFLFNTPVHIYYVYIVLTDNIVSCSAFLPVLSWTYPMGSVLGLACAMAAHAGSKRRQR